MPRFFRGMDNQTDPVNSLNFLKKYLIQGVLLLASMLFIVLKRVIGAILCVEALQKQLQPSTEVVSSFTRS